MDILVNIFWGYHVLGLIFLIGIRLTLGTNFFQIRKFFSMIKTVFKSEKTSEKGVSSFAALSTALAGSIGTGNIVGVGLAISVGGAGAIFWLWVSALFGMMTVFGEVVLSIKHKRKGVVGAFSYIEKVGKGKVLPFVYGLGCVLSSLAMGNMAQANSVACAVEIFGIPKIFIAIILSIIIFILTNKGIKSVAKLTEKLVPIMTVFFFCFSLIMLYMCRERLPIVINEIFTEAFSLKSTISGGMIVAMRVGISRGVFTNEAGLGTSSMAFSNVHDKSPVEVGYLGIFQVFMDTTVMCTVTALCILCGTTERTGDYLVKTAFTNVLGDFGGIGMNVCMGLFAFATMTATSYYGKTGLNYIAKGKLDGIFPFLFATATFIGTIMPITKVFDICDAFNGLMAIPNLIALSLFSSQIVTIVKKNNKLHNLL